MATIIAISNQKGGVGKTTSAHNIGVALASHFGKKTLLIDLDPQTNLTIVLGFELLDYENIDHNITSLLAKKPTEIQKAIYAIKDNLYLVPSSIDLASMEMELHSRPSREKILERALESIKDDFDYIIIDCPPQLSILTINALSVADYVVVPVKTDLLAYRGMSQLLATIDEIKYIVNPKLKFAGIIGTMHEKIISTDKEILSILEDEYPVLGVVKKAAAAKSGAASGKSAVDLSPKSEVSQAYISIAEKIISLKEKENE